MQATYTGRTNTGALDHGVVVDITVADFAADCYNDGWQALDVRWDGKRVAGIEFTPTGQRTWWASLDVDA